MLVVTDDGLPDADGFMADLERLALPQSGVNGSARGWRGLRLRRPLFIRRPVVQAPAGWGPPRASMRVWASDSPARTVTVSRCDTRSHFMERGLDFLNMIREGAHLREAAWGQPDEHMLLLWRPVGGWVVPRARAELCRGTGMQGKRHGGAHAAASGPGRTWNERASSGHCANGDASNCHSSRNVRPAPCSCVVNAWRGLLGSWR